MMYFSIWMLYFLVMEQLSFMCRVLKYRPGQAGCQLVHGPGSKPPALYIVFACDLNQARHVSLKNNGRVNCLPKNCAVESASSAKFALYVPVSVA